jgi:hypothetical protein
MGAGLQGAGSGNVTNKRRGAISYFAVICVIRVIGVIGVIGVIRVIRGTPALAAQVQASSSFASSLPQLFKRLRVTGQQARRQAGRADQRQFHCGRYLF